MVHPRSPLAVLSLPEALSVSGAMRSGVARARGLRDLLRLQRTDLPSSPDQVHCHSLPPLLLSGQGVAEQEVQPHGATWLQEEIQRFLAEEGFGTRLNASQGG